MTSLRRDGSLDRREWVEPDLPEARVEESWQKIAERTRKPASRARVIAPAAALAAAAALVIAFVATRDDAPDDRRSAWVGTSLRTGAEPMDVELADGSEIDAAPNSRLELLEGTERTVRVALRRGSATFEVTRNPSREFFVEADDVTVRVVGTRFAVRRAMADGAETIEVDVTRGRVEVRAAGETRVLGAGETWRRRRTESVAVTRAEAPVEDAVQDAPESTERRASRRARRTPREDRGAGVIALFDEARAARRAGDPRQAAELYAQLVREHHADPRAPLAALELGRIRQDALGDHRGAIEALDTALALSPSGPFREDALARLVRAHDELGARAACQRARERYLAAYPEGRWAEDVRPRCD